MNRPAYPIFLLWLMLQLWPAVRLWAQPCPTGGGYIRVEGRTVQQYCEATTVTITNSHDVYGSRDYSYQWQKSGGGTHWEDISGATGAEYTPGEVRTTTWYRRKVTAHDCTRGPGIDYSNTVMVVILPPVTAGTIGGSQSLCYGRGASLTSETLAGGGTGRGYAYQWQRKTTDGAWEALSGGNGPAYRVRKATETAQYRRRVIHDCGEVYSNTITLEVDEELQAGTIGGDQTVCYGSSATGLVSQSSAKGSGPLSYQWERRIRGRWQSIGGATGPDYAPTDHFRSTMSYRRKVSNDCGSKYSNVVTITSRRVLSAGSMLPPAALCPGDDPPVIEVGSPPSGGTGAYTYQWEQKHDHNDAWEALAGATGATYDPPVPEGPTWYRRVVSDACGTAYNTLMLRVPQPLDGGQLRGDRSYCQGETINIANRSYASGGRGSHRYFWEERIPGGEWRTLRGSRSRIPNFYSPGRLTASREYRRGVSDDCMTAYTPSVLITVFEELTGGEITGDQAICYGEVPNIRSLTDPGGGEGSYRYRWSSRRPGQRWRQYAEGGPDLAAKPLTETTEFRRQVLDGCGHGWSNTVTVEVTAAIDPGRLAGNDQLICYESRPAPLEGWRAASGGSGALTYQWQAREPGGTWEDLAGATGEDYHPELLTATREFRRGAGDGCYTVYTEPVTVAVKENMDPGAIAGDQNICYGEKPSRLRVSTSVPYPYRQTASRQWQQRTPGGSWTDIPGATSVSSYQPPSLTETTEYRLKVTNDCLDRFTNTVTITVYALLEAGAIGTSGVARYEETLELETTPARGGDPRGSYLWEESFDGSTWTAITGHTSEGYRTPRLTQDTWYRRTYRTNQCGEVTAPVIKFTVSPPSPTGLQVSTEVPNRVELRWRDNSSNELGFKLWRSEGGGSFVAIQVLPADLQYYVDRNVRPGTEYAYFLTSFRGEGPEESESFPTNTVTIHSLELLEENTTLGMAPQFNGNIAGIRWYSANGHRENRYTYHYDALDRLISAGYAQKEASDDFDHHQGAFSVPRIKYDHQGNIQSLERNRRQAALVKVSDALEYSYQGNQLINVTDRSGDDGGFKDDLQADGNRQDYGYDVNGNMDRDLNKGITGITYNHLNLPEVVTLSPPAGSPEGSTTKIEYVYDASGVKLQQKIYEGDSDTPAKVIDYMGEFIYETIGGEEPQLKEIQHEQGRLVPGPDPGSESWTYQYHLRDHLGNVRVTFTTEPNTWPYTATMETNETSIEFEETFFQRVAETRSNARKPANVTDGGAYSAELHAARPMGPGVSIALGPGDQVDLSVWAYYEDPTVRSDRAGIVGLAALVSNSLTSIPGLAEGVLESTLSDQLAGTPFLGGPDREENSPAAFLNWMVFDGDYQLIGDKTGFRRVESGKTVEDPPHQLTHHIEMEEAGYLVVYVSNETEDPGVVVHFDELMVTHRESPVVQTDDYYPFGLTFNSYQRVGNEPNRWKFQGQEHIDDLDIGWIQFKWRNHDPSIGRFFNIDPLADDYVYNSPYAFSENHVTTHIELEGLEKVYIFDQAENPDNKRVYTAEAFVESAENGVEGPFRFSTFPNNDETQNTVNTGEHQFNNESGHSQGSKKGLNIVNADGERVAPGTDPDGNPIEMTVVNIHSGVDPEDNGGLHNRGSAGCPTCHPDDAAAFFSNFDFSGSSGNTGDAEGTVTIFRGHTQNSTVTRDLLEFKQGLQNLNLTPTVPADNTRVASGTTVFLRKR